MSVLKQIAVAVALIAAWSLVPLVTPADRTLDHRAWIGAHRIKWPSPLTLLTSLEATLAAQPNRGPINIVAPYRVTVGATAVQLTSSGNVNAGVCVKALVPGQTMYLGLSGVATATGWPMTDNESLCLEVRNANVLYAIASAAAQSVAVLPFSRF